jgi:hypothetical protein
MLDNLAPDPGSESDRLDLAADQAIAACGGDMRSAIRALILANEYLELEFEALQAKVSLGYGRGKQSARPLPKDRKDWYD